MRERVLSWFRELRNPEPMPHASEFIGADPAEITDIIRENILIRSLYEKMLAQANYADECLVGIRKLATDAGASSYLPPARRYKAQTALDQIATIATLRRVR